MKAKIYITDKSINVHDGKTIIASDAYISNSREEILQMGGKLFEHLDCEYEEENGKVTVKSMKV